MEIERSQLYLLVWSKPVVQISKELNISTTELRKACKTNNIPLPEMGYWQKIKYGKKVRTISLPHQVKNNKIEFKLQHIKKKENSFEVKPNIELISVLASKKSKLHKYTIATKRYYKERKARERKRDWSSQLDESNVLSISVSESLFSRSLQFMDILIKMLEDKGFEVSASGSTTVTIRNQKYNLRLAEKNKRVKRETNYSWDTFDLVPTGFLVLRVDRSFPIKEWSDTKTKNLEEKLSIILDWLCTRAKDDEKQEIATKAWRKSYEEKRQREREFQELQNDDLKKFKKLLFDVQRYHRSIELREYIKQFELSNVCEDELPEEKIEWLKWAKAKADWVDPFVSIKDNLLGEFSEGHLPK